MVCNGLPGEDIVKVAELREMKTVELHGELDRIRRHLFDLHAQAVTEKLENPHQLKAVRKNIARILTLLNERGETGVEEQQYHLESIATHRKGG